MGDIREQTDWALRNLAAVLEAAGTSLERVVKATVFMKDGVDSAAMNEEYLRHFREPLPARRSSAVPSQALHETPPAPFCRASRWKRPARSSLINHVRSSQIVRAFTGSSI